jgi:DMSO/TMAO reductase YedYZ molybdopterin-dependent catalytic subunit
MATRGFSARNRGGGAEQTGRLPPGQFLTTDFPVLSAGPTPQIAREDWRLALQVGPRTVKSWSWADFIRLPITRTTPDIHCVTKWSKFDTNWEGVSIQDLLADAGLEPPTAFMLAHSYDDYSTNVPVKDLLDGRGMIAIAYDGKPITPEHGGPARLLVPHLYLWKSAKWVKGLQFTQRDEAGFWEVRGYHMYGDPWKEQRYSGD